MIINLISLVWACGLVHLMLKAWDLMDRNLSGNHCGTNGSFGEGFQLARVKLNRGGKGDSEGIWDVGIFIWDTELELEEDGCLS